MNEWNRLADISTGTRRYLGKSEVQRMNLAVAAKLAKIHRAKNRFERDSQGGRDSKYLQDVPEAYPMAVELPAAVPAQPPYSPPPRPSYESGHHDTLEVPSQHKTPSPRSSNENQSRPNERKSRHSPQIGSPKPESDGDRLMIHNPTPSQYRNAGSGDKIAIPSLDEYPEPKTDQPKPLQGRIDPPPLPPKTPIQDSAMPTARVRPLPYPIDDGPPPAVNMARKPDYR